MFQRLTRSAYRRSLLLSVLLLSRFASGQASPDPHLRALLRASASGDMHGISGKYVGPGSCSAVACHGGIEPRSTTKVLQNEYSTWVTADKHAHGYTALTEPLGRQISTLLKIGPAEKQQRCLVCHALSRTAAERERDFEVREGVSCESCHGPASGWLEQHIRPGAKHADMVSLHLVDNKSLTVRTKQCLTCHLGSEQPGMTVDHELIAAGHPDLTFELDSFSAVEPPHWIEKARPDDRAPADPMFGVRAWAVGQAVELEESMHRVARHAETGPWPEFSEMDCVTCHHALTGPQSWRQQAGFPGHSTGRPEETHYRAGNPPYNLSRFVLFRHFSQEVDPALNTELANETGHVAVLVSSMSSDRRAVEASANRAAALAIRMEAAIRDVAYDRPRADRLLRAISGDSDSIAFAGERTAERATMTLDSLYIAEAKGGAANPETRAAIDGLFKLVKNASAYDARQFSAQLKKVRSTLR